MKIKHTLILASALFGAAVQCLAQDFTLENELRKQQKRYPFITPYETDTTGVISILNVEYRTVGERTLTVDIFLPADTAGRTFELVAIVHGGGWRSGSKQMDHPMAAALARNGFAAMCVDYRKSDEALYPAAIVDVKCALRFARCYAARYHFATEPLTIMGTSAGGQLASLIGSINHRSAKYHCPEYAAYSDHVDRVVDIDGVLAFIHPDSNEGADKPGKPSAATLWFGATASEAPELWREASALSHVGEQSADFLFIRSGQKRFSAGYAEMMEHLRKHNRKAEVRSTTDTPHTFWLFNPWTPDVVSWIVEWLR